MKNYINKNINNEIKWSREIVRKPKKGRINGLNIWDKTEKSDNRPNGYCGSIEIDSGGILRIWTNGRYQYISKKITRRLVEELLKIIT